MQKALRNGRRFFIEGGIFLVVENKQEKARFAVIVGKKITKKATARNYLRRFYYALLGFFLTDFKGLDCVLIVQNKDKPKFEEGRRGIAQLIPTIKSKISKKQA